MLNVKVSESGITMTAGGAVVEILADITIVIHNLYSTMYKQDKRIANEFRTSLMRAIADPKGPVWNEDGVFSNHGHGFMITMPRKREGGDPK